MEMSWPSSVVGQGNGEGGDNPIIYDPNNPNHIIIHMGMKIYGNEGSDGIKQEIYYPPVVGQEFIVSPDVKTTFKFLKYDVTENFSIALPSEININNGIGQGINELDDKCILQSVLQSANPIEIVEGPDYNDVNGIIQENGEKRYWLRNRKSPILSNEYLWNQSISRNDQEEISNENIIFKCSKCLEEFNDEESLVNHENNFVQCSGCASYFCSKVILEAHHKTCPKVNDNQIIGGTGQMFEGYATSLENCVSLNSNNLADNSLLKCEKCKQIFSDNSKLILHTTENPCCNVEDFTCDTCKRTFSDFDSLKQHIAEHLGSSLQCITCNESFGSETSLSAHKCPLTARNENACKLCNKTFKKEEKLRIHVLRHQGISYRCLKCNKPFSSQVLQHKHTVNCSPRVQKCANCGKIFRNNYRYMKHVRLHVRSTNGSETCAKKSSPQCKIGVNSGSDFGSASKHDGYKCENCGDTFSNPNELQYHILGKHRGSKNECRKCCSLFASREELNAHNCKMNDSCRCKVCGKFFAKKEYLRKHEYTHSNMVYKCKFCYCAFMKEKGYKRHVERMNCSKSARKIKLSQFDYKKCRICVKDFADEDLLIKHFNSDHPGENPHQCFCCDSRLPTFKELQSHIHLHNTRKFTCGLCGKPYTSQEGFRKHRFKHKGAQFKCRFCESEFLNENRYKFHVASCKKNPERGYSSTETMRPTQKRQVHWESRIIMKHLRGDPNSATIKSANVRQIENGHVPASVFFDEPDSDSSDSNVRGWFDDYYKTEEDDFAFGLKKDVPSGRQGNEDGKQEDTKMAVVAESPKSSRESEGDKARDSDVEESSESSEEDVIEEVDLPVDYNPKKCRICMTEFSHEYELLHHFIKAHPNKKAHRCPNCDVECPLFAQLKEHMKTHGIGIGIYNCDNCSKRFRSEKKMKSHNVRCKGANAEGASAKSKELSRAGPNGEEYCKRCCKTFQTKCGYRRHRQICKEKWKNNKEIKKSENVMAESEVVGEKEELKEAVEDDGISCEVAADTSDGELPTKTLQTSEENPSTSPKEKDVESKGGYAEEPPTDSFPCRICDKKFQYERGIVMHFKSDHPGHKPLVCHICNMHLADKLKEHLKTHGIGEEFVCELCGKRFNQKFSSKIHEMWHQGIEYKCGNCKQKFLNKEKMDKHVSENRCSNRQSLMRLPCDICGKSYQSKFGLNKHHMTHTPKELRPVKNRMNCEFCGKWFESNNGLQRHRRIHTGERPFCCRFCSKAFAQEGNCKAHEKIHMGEGRKRKSKKSVVSDPVPYHNNINSYQ